MINSTFRFRTPSVNFESLHPFLFKSFFEGLYMEDILTFFNNVLDFHTAQLYDAFY